MLFVILFGISLSSTAQKIESDKGLGKERHISTSLISVVDEKTDTPWGFYLTGGYSSNYIMEEMDDSLVFFLNIIIRANDIIEFPEKPIILYKLFDDLSFVGRASYTSSVKNKTQYNNCVVLALFDSTLRMFNRGLKKIRVETTEGYEEIEFTEDEVGNLIYDSFHNIVDRFKEKKKHVLDDF